jgi:hypothetical protein
MSGRGRGGGGLGAGKRTVEEIEYISDSEDEHGDYKKAKVEEKKSGGMMFTFISDDRQVTSYICRDPVFQTVIGLQTNTDFLTEEMVEHMKYEISIDDPERDLSGFDYPLKDGYGWSLLYFFCDCMEICTGGETSTASYLKCME